MSWVGLGLLILAHVEPWWLMVGCVWVALALVVGRACRHDAVEYPRRGHGQVDAGRRR
jgi:hypothetical protein